MRPLEPPPRPSGATLRVVSLVLAFEQRSVMPVGGGLLDQPAWWWSSVERWRGAMAELREALAEFRTRRK